MRGLIKRRRRGAITKRAPRRRATTIRPLCVEGSGVRGETEEPGEDVISSQAGT
jgi:hypothetical protein